MRDQTIISVLKQLENKINSSKRQINMRDREIINLRLQVNAIIAVFKLFKPLNWLLGYLYGIEYRKYSNQMMKQRQEMMKMQSGVANEENITKKQEIIGRNDQCTCGSGKKYKKCCLTKKLNKK